MLVQWEVRGGQLTLDQLSVAHWGYQGAGLVTVDLSGHPAPRPCPELHREWVRRRREGAADLRPVEGSPLRRAGRTVAGLQDGWAWLRARAVVQSLLLCGRHTAQTHHRAAAHAHITAAAAARPVPYNPAVGNAEALRVYRQGTRPLED